MADNTILSSGSGGDTIATDDISGVKFPRSKITIGADGVNDGDVSSSNPMPVDITSATIDVMLGTDFSSVFGTSSLITATQADDVANTTDGLNCTSFGYVFDGTTWDRLRGDSTNGVLVNLGSNNDVTLATLPDTAAGDLAAINAALAGTVTVSGTVTANLSATDNAVLDTIETNTDFGTVTGGGVEASALRVTLASDSTGVLSVDDGGGSLTVDGTVTANLSATDNAVLDTIAANTSNLTNCIVQDDSPFTPATGYLMMIGGEFDDAGTDSVDEGDAGNIRISANRCLYVNVRDNAGNERGLNVDANGDIGVTNAGTFAVQVDNFTTPNADSMVDDTNDALRVNVVAGGGSGGTSATDDGAFTAASGSGTPIMGFATADAVDSGDVGVVAMQTNRSLNVHVTGNDVATGGTSSTDDSAFTAGSGSGTPAMGFFSTDTVNSGDVGVLAMDASRRLLVSIEADNAGIGGGTQYAVDAALGSTPTGTLAIGIRDDALSTLTPVEGDAVGLRVDANGALWTTVSGTVTVDATSSGDVPITLDGEAVSITGTVTVDLGANNDVTIDGSSIVHAEDAVHNSGDAGVMSLAVRNDTLAALAGTDGDYAPLQVNASGALFIQEGSALDVSAATVTVDNAGTFAVQVDGTALTRLTDIETNTDFGTTTGNGTATGALRVTVASDSTGVLSVDDNGSTLSVDDGAGSLTVDNGGTFAVQPTASASGGASIFRSIDLDESEEEVKSTAATFYGGVAINLTASVLYLKFYNATAAGTTVGSTTPVMTIPIPTQGDTNGAGFILPVPACGVEFTTALTVACTTGVADADTGAPAANACVVNLFYE